MKTIFYIYLFIFWAILWSFWSVLIYRLKSNEKWILFGRSHCSKCNHNLWFFELIPIFSWLKNLWKCKYCKQKVSYIYPLLEISTGICFMFVWIFLINFEQIISLNIIEIIKLIFWLFIIFITILYIFYDILFTEIHEWIMLAWILVAFLWLIWNNFIEINHLIKSFNKITNIEFFWSLWISVTILLALYTIMIKWLKEIYDVIVLIVIWLILYTYKVFFPETNFTDNFILSWIIWAFWIFIFFFLQILLSWWRALWWWDLRIWIMIWLLLWISFSYIWIIITYLVWSIIWIFVLIKNRKNKWPSVVPFWPFLWIWFLITLFFNEEIISFIRNYFLFM